MPTARESTLKHKAELVPVSSVHTYPGNARRGDVDLIRESLRVNGQYRPLVVQRSTRQVLAGNHTLEAAIAEGYEQIWITEIDVDDQQAKRIVAVDNRSNDAATYDLEALSTMLSDLGDLAGTGYSNDDLAKMTEHVEFDATPVDLPANYSVLVTCADEMAQVTLLDRLRDEGFECRALIS